MALLTPVHAPADGAIVTEFARFLEAGSRLGVLVREGQIQPGERLADTVERALSADLVVVFLSPEAVSRRASGAEWEAMLGSGVSATGGQVASVLVSACTPPALLKRNLLETGDDPLAAFRQIKRWAIARIYAQDRAHPSATPRRWNRRLEELRRGLADAPGRVHLAAAEAHLVDAFVDACEGDFEKTIRLDCAGRYRENIIGELCAAAGLATPGPIEADERAAEGALSEARILLVCENFSEAGWLPPLGRLCSLLTTEPVVAWEARPGDVLDRLRRWNTSERGGLNLAPAAHGLFESCRLNDWPAAREAGRLAYLILKRAERWAEAALWLERLERAALDHGDRDAAFESAGERAWIAERWGAVSAPGRPPDPEPEQLRLSF